MNANDETTLEISWQWMHGSAIWWWIYSRCSTTRASVLSCRSVNRLTTVYTAVLSTSSAEFRQRDFHSFRQSIRRRRRNISIASDLNYYRIVSILYSVICGGVICDNATSTEDTTNYRIGPHRYNVINTPHEYRAQIARYVSLKSSYWWGVHRSINNQKTKQSVLWMRNWVSLAKSSYLAMRSLPVMSHRLIVACMQLCDQCPI